MLFESKQTTIKKSKFAERFMILYMINTIVKLLDGENEDDMFTKEIVEISLEEIFASVLKMDNGIWN